MEKVKDKYQERVRAIAEEMAAEKHNRERGTGHPYFTELADYTKRQKINSHLPAAGIAVAEMAEAVIIACHLLKSPATAKEIDAYLKEKGLIPDEGLEAIVPMQPGDLGSVHNPENPEPDRWPPAKGLENKPLDTTGEWLNICCQNCGWTGSSEFLDGGGQIADTGDYGDTYCPNCGQVDPDDYMPDQEAGSDAS